MPEEALITIATRHQSHYERLKSAEVNKYDKFLQEMDRDLRMQLSGANITDFTRARLEQQLKQVRKAMSGTMADYRKVWSDSISDAALYEAGFEHRSLGKVVEGVNFSMPSDTQISAAVLNTPLGDIGGASGGSLLSTFFDDMAESQIRKIEGAIRLGYAQGETTQKIMQRIRGTRAAGFSDGLWATTKRDIESVTRTALQHAAAQARDAVWKANRKVIKGEKVSATLDSKTSSQCRSLDGQIFPLDEGPRPPFHIRCRSSMVAVLVDKYAELSRGRTRSMRDPETGKVESISADTTYYGWLKSQPASVQNSIIGPTRGKLLRNGGLSAQRFSELQLGRNFEPLTLDEMRKLEPIAFEKAGL